MILHNYELSLPSYSVGENVYNLIGEKCLPYGKNILVIGGTRAIAAAKEKIEKAVRLAGMTILEYVVYGKDCTYAAVEKLRNLPVYTRSDMVFAVGGGKALDTCKNLCIVDNKPLFTFPTIASNCAACTSVSIMYKEDGTFLKPHFFLHPAIHAFIDTEIMAGAPDRYMWAGIGDTYAKYYEAEISSRGEVLQHFTALGVAMSKECLEPLVRYGAEALADNKTGKNSYALEQTVLAIVVTTAIVSIFLTRDFTPDYNSGLAHAVFYALTTYPVIEREHLHGEVVGFGVLIALLCDGQEEEFAKIYALNKELGLPTKLEDIGITPEQFEEAMGRIPEMSDVKHYPYKITRNMLQSAMERL
ncbi:MAG: iron-containing alcohol dehydrogenase family protein [Lachnospiraceae bacterium]|nr:iron-containing alcohol dehydrogenase family protein [Lachnospiraceae bacterium]